MSQYPEHEKLKAVENEASAISEFLQWLDHETPFTICCLDTDGRRSYVPTMTPYGQIMGQFFDIDPKKLSAEKDEMLAEIRRQGAGE